MPVAVGRCKWRLRACSGLRFGITTDELFAREHERA
jgi:hypothetical protein